MAATPKIGDWIQLTKDAHILWIEGDDFGSYQSAFKDVAKGSIGKVVGRINHQWLIRFNSTCYRCPTSSIRFHVISPKKYKALEVLYGT